jgi:hypothetical protein
LGAGVLARRAERVRNRRAILGAGVLARLAERVRDRRR